MTVDLNAVNFIASAASAAAKARSAAPTLPTEDPLDVATALKCMSEFQDLEGEEGLALLDDESYAAPLVAAARILQSTAQQLHRSPNPPPRSDLDELHFYASLAFAMQGNFPSAKATMSEVSAEFIESSATYKMVACICDPCSTILSAPCSPPFESFSVAWRDALRAPVGQERQAAFEAAMRVFFDSALHGSIAEGALALSAGMAAEQAMRLATMRLIDDAPGIPNWFVSNTVDSGLVTLLPPQRQLLAIKDIASHRRNTLLTLPTSTGKTFIAEACIAAGLTDGGLCVYVAPYVAVGEQVKTSLAMRVREQVPIVSMFGGFQLERLDLSAQGEILVATPERFDAWLRAGEGLERLRTVVIDEIHILENGNRGARVEGLVSRLRLLQRDNQHLRLIGLSAVLTEPQRVCDWLGVAKGDVHQIGWRPTARRLAVCLANGNMYWIHGNDSLRPGGARPNAALSEVVNVPLPGVIVPAQYPNANEKSAALNVATISADLLNRLGFPGLVVCPRKLDTRLLARMLKERSPESTDQDLHAAAASIQTQYPWMKFLADCISHGIAYHNASLPFDVRRTVEDLTRQRKLRVVCATTTLAEGADLPFRWTLVSHWLSTMREGGAHMKSMTFRNIAGRCGRAGAFSEGDTVLFENRMGPPSRTRAINVKALEQVMFSSMALESTAGKGFTAESEITQHLLEATFSSQLLACVGENPQVEDVVSEFVAASYTNHGAGAENLKRILNAALADMLDANRQGGALAVANSPVRLTGFGAAANLSGFSPATCRQMTQYLAADEFLVGPELYANLLRRFKYIPEQANEVLRKVLSGAKHKNVIKDGKLEQLLKDLLTPLDVRTVFDRLRDPKSTAQPETVDTWFEDFVSFVDGVVGNFLPWLLRGLQTLSQHGSAAATQTDWAEMARSIEAKLAERGPAADLDAQADVD